MVTATPLTAGNETESSSSADEALIVERIYKAVMEQRLSPNTKLSESKLCATFGVGRMRVRRALLLLSSQGIIDLHSNRGAFVACPGAKEADEVFEARLLIEPPLVAKLAEDTNPDGLKTLSDHIAMEDEARTKDERTDLIRLSGEFHVKLANVAGNEVIRRIMRELVTRTSLIVGLFGSSERSSCPDDEHAKILNAIEMKEPEVAKSLIVSHLTHIQLGLDMSTRNTSPDDLKTILGQI